ncbi:MAG: Mrp/NBP35 family ATP-binding protein [Deltaproteobacteria bacterium]|nr:Mrp/NBP35 family ATP-binding protein [Deltaproteobacteria bacterium]
MLFKQKESASVSEQEVLRVLSEVYDPDLHRDIVELGFIKNLNIVGGDVSFTLELTTPACPVKDELRSQCIARVKALSGVRTVNVNMTAAQRRTVPQAGRIQLAGVKNVIAVASGKGGVGKSTVAINLTVALAHLGAKAGILDADIYGPSIPLMMGTNEKPTGSQEKLIPIEKDGIKIMSMGFLVSPDQPVIWRGPMVHGVLVQFLSQVDWGELDYLVIDMPPGTGDAQLTISQSAPLSGAIIVTTPQEVSLIDARKGLLMFHSVNVPILGVIENMAGFVCEHCSNTTHIFRKGGGRKIAQELKVPFLGSVPLDTHVAEGGDFGTPIVSSHPNSPAAKLFITMAGDVAAELSIASSEAAGVFKPLKLEWQNQ